MVFNQTLAVRHEVSASAAGGHGEPVCLLGCTTAFVPGARPFGAALRQDSDVLDLPVAAAVYCLESCNAAVPLARSFVRRQMTHWDVDPAVTDDACLVCSELVTNAVQHSGSDDVTVSLIQGYAFLWIHVADHGCWRDRDAPPAEQICDRGRGMALVAAVASAYDLHTTNTGTCAWAALAKHTP